jgi:ribosome-associated heat shock protein Hsp15
VRVNGDRAKAAQPVRIGDEVRVRAGGSVRILVGPRLVVKRGGAGVAAECSTHLTPPPPPRASVPAAPAVRDRGAGRPTKRERRDLDKLRGR